MGTRRSEAWVWMVGNGLKQLTGPFASGQVRRDMDFGCSWGASWGNAAPVGVDGLSHSRSAGRRSHTPTTREPSLQSRVTPQQGG